MVDGCCCCFFFDLLFLAELCLLSFMANCRGTIVGCYGNRIQLGNKCLRPLVPTFSNGQYYGLSSPTRFRVSRRGARNNGNLWILLEGDDNRVRVCWMPLPSYCVLYTCCLLVLSCARLEKQTTIHTYTTATSGILRRTRWRKMVVTKKKPTMRQS